MFSNTSIKKLLIPLVIEQILLIFVGMADTMMVSYAGEAAMSGVSLVDMYVFMIITILTAIGTGGAVIVSQYLGNKDRENANISANQLMLISFLISTVMMLFTLIFHNGILKLFFGSIEADVMQAANTYILVMACSFPFFRDI